MPVDANTIPSTRARAAQYAGYIVSYAMKIKQLLSGGWTPDILPIWREGVEQVKFHINRELKQRLCWKYSTLCYSILKMASAGERRRSSTKSTEQYHDWWRLPRTSSTKYQDCWRLPSTRLLETEWKQKRWMLEIFGLLPPVWGGTLHSGLYQRKMYL